jgi:hypothetical protein
MLYWLNHTEKWNFSWWYSSVTWMPWTQFESRACKMSRIPVSLVWHFWIWCSLRVDKKLFSKDWKYKAHTEKNLSTSPIYKHRIFHVWVTQLDKKLLFLETPKFHLRTHYSLLLDYVPICAYISQTAFFLWCFPIKISYHHFPFFVFLSNSCHDRHPEESKFKIDHGGNHLPHCMWDLKLIHVWSGVYDRQEYSYNT